MKRGFILGLLICLALASFVSAHQPRIVSSETTFVSNPEVSQAFYGELNGNASYFVINSKEPFKLYLGLLVPDSSGQRTDFNVEISLDDNLIGQLNGSNYNWTKFYEEFAGDNYLWGPELRANVSSGEYKVAVYNSNNRGKYVLAVGETESFPFKEVLNAMWLLPKLKTWFFGKSVFHVFDSKYAKIFGLIILVIFALIVLAVVLVVRRLRIKKAKRT